MSLREAAQQALEALCLPCDRWNRRQTEIINASITALRAALANTQDWYELEALRASRREHMAEIHRLRAAGRQALGALQFCLPLIEDYGDEEQLASHHKALAALTEYAMQRLTDVQQEIENGANTVQSLGGIYSRVFDSGDRNVEAVTDCHEKEGGNLSPPFERNADPGKTFDVWSDDTPEQRMLRKKWFGGRLYGHLPFLEAVDETMRSLHAELDEALGTWKMLDEDTCKTSDHIPAAGKMVDQSEEALEMVATINEMETVEPVAWMVYTLDGKSAFVTDNPADFTPQHRALPLYTAPPQRKPLTDEEIEQCCYDADQNADDHTDEWTKRFARAIERAHGIGGKE